MFSALSKTKIIILSTLVLSSANALNLDQCKIFRAEFIYQFVSKQDQERYDQKGAGLLGEGPTGPQQQLPIIPPSVGYVLYMFLFFHINAQNFSLL